MGDDTSRSGRRLLSTSSLPHHVTGAGRAAATGAPASTTAPATAARATTRLVTEVPPTGEDHRGSRARDGVDDVAVAPRAAGLDDRRHTSVERELRAVREREERIGREHRAREIVPVLARFVDRDPDGVDAAHLPRSDADRREILRDD